MLVFSYYSKLALFVKRDKYNHSCRHVYVLQVTWLVELQVLAIRASWHCWTWTHWEWTLLYLATHRSLLAAARRRNSLLKHSFQSVSVYVCVCVLQYNLVINVTYYSLKFYTSGVQSWLFSICDSALQGCCLLKCFRVTWFGHIATFADSTFKIRHLCHSLT